jgi:hypothetical protein
MFNLLLAAVLSAASVLIILYVTSLLLRSLRLGVLIENWRLQRYIARVRLGDQCLDKGDVAKAVLRYQQALYPHPARTREVADAIKRHHIGLLSRLLAAADQVQGDSLRLISLARADRLFQDRDILQRRCLAARSKGKGVHELERELRSNTIELRAALTALAVEITAARPTERTH